MNEKPEHLAWQTAVSAAVKGSENIWSLRDVRNALR